MRQTQLNWCGHPYDPEKGESYYGGPPEQIREGCPPGDAPKRDRREVIRREDVAAIFKDGPLTKVQAVRQLVSQGFSRATSYRALNETGRFAKHLRYENGKLSWR